MSSRKKSIKIDFWCISVLMAHLEDELNIQTTHSLLILRNESIRKTTYHKHDKTYELNKIKSRVKPWTLV